jgi:hypothetical protein
VLCFSETCLRRLLARAGFAVTQRLDAPPLDEALTQGKPTRLRLLATRTAAAPDLDGDPLRPAVTALRTYARGRGMLSRLVRIFPVRLRAAVIDWARDR